MSNLDLGQDLLSIRTLFNPIENFTHNAVSTNPNDSIILGDIIDFVIL